MTTKTRFKAEYYRNEKSDRPILRLSITASLFTFLKAWILGEYAWHYLTDEEVDLLARYVARYKIVRRLREDKKDAT